MKTKILLRGPVLTRSGYGEQTRFALRALRSRADLFDIYVQPLKWGQTSWLNEADSERQWIDSTIERTIAYIQQGGNFDSTVQVTIPNEWEKLTARDIGYTAGIETTKVAYSWIEKGNLMDNIIVVSDHSKSVYETTVNYPVKHIQAEPVELELSTAFNFLCVAQWGPRKNMHSTLRWFVEEFRDEDVGLVLKSNIAKNSVLDREALLAQVTAILHSLGDRQCKVYLLHGDMTEGELHSLYTHPKINALVSFPHGEGFGLPLFEAAYSGMPVVATGWSGQLDFLVNKKTGKNRFYNVEYDLQPVQKEVVWEGVIIKDSMWAYTREQSAKQKMRECYYDLTSENGDETREKFKQYAAEIDEEFGAEKMYKQFVDAVLGTDSATVKSPTSEVLEFE